MSSSLPRTFGELRASGYQSLPVKAELRKNLIRKLQSGEPLFPGILGYDETVVPQVENAILSHHDLLFLGLRGQGKTRMLRQLVNLLDPHLPIIAGSEIHDDPFHPISKFGKDQISKLGDDCPIAWIEPEQRYHEKLATPDVTIADLIGEVDLIKHAEGRHLANEDVLHFGLIPRSHRGIFCMNELPDLSPKIQVGLFNVLEERDVQIRGFPIRLELDLLLVFSANPEDYTNRGRIVTPLKDRIGSVIRTHYPLSRELGMQITDDNAWTHRDGGVTVHVPKFMKEIVEEISRLARTSSHVNQASGVSVRMSIANFENVVSNAERRALRTVKPTAGGAAKAGPQANIIARLCDLAYLSASSLGKIELNLTEDSGQEEKLIGRIVGEAVKNIFDQRLKPQQFKNVVEFFEGGNTVELSDGLSAVETIRRVSGIRNFSSQMATLAKDLEPELSTATAKDDALRDDLIASLAEFVLESLHVHNRLNKNVRLGAVTYGS